MALPVLLKGMLPTMLMVIGESLMTSDLGLDIATSIKVPKAYGVVLIVNGIVPVFTLAALGFKVAQARKKFNVPYPTMYAIGGSEEDKKFNCVQRGHQHAFETYTQFVALSLIGGLRHPITTALAGIVWTIARLRWAEGYASGDPEKRYSSPWGACVWYSLVAVMTTAGSTALGILGIL
eukprot:GGOE01061074.1.p1 GENE.GGOE01061074.1~~GGOE01061074.1.p1  ORF type:complete len:179 (+),score=25.58 GGOE01061074.1:40-576(+)